MAASHLRHKFERARQTVKSAWRLFIVIIVYSVLASIFLGTSCLMASTLGLPCPGCGATRAFLLLFSADIALSLHFHPLLIPAILCFGAYFIAWLTYEHIPRPMERMLVIFAIVMVVFYFLRMILYFPRETPMVFNYDAILPRIVRMLINC